MPGLFGSLTNSVHSDPHCIQRMGEKLTYFDKYKINGLENHAAVAHHGRFNHEVVYQNEHVALLIDGWIVSVNNEELQNEAAYQIGQLYLTQGLNFVNHLNGQFNILIHDKKTDEWHLISDRGASRQMFYCIFKNTFTFAPEAKAISAGIQRRFKINEKQIYNQLTFSRIWLGNETFFSDVYAMPPGHIFTWRNGHLHKKEYWEWIYCEANRTFQDVVDEGVDIFRKTTTSINNSISNNLSLMLSGGLDSRLVLASIAKPKRKNIHCYTLGASQQNDEVSVAKHVANKAGCNWKALLLGPEDFINNGQLGNKIMEGLDLLPQSYSLTSCLSINKSESVFINGLLFDVVMGGLYLDGSVFKEPYNHQIGRDYTIKKFTYFNQNEFLEMYQQKDGIDVYNHQLQRLENEYYECKNEKSPNRIDEIVFKNRFSRYLIPRQYLLRLFFEEYIPAYDSRLLEFFLRIPLEYRQNYKLFQSILIQLDESLSKIEYVNTTMPANAPTEYWNRGKNIEYQKELLYREIFYKTKGSTFIPYTHYYSNFDEWLRLNKKWMNTADELLLSSDSRLSGNFIKQEYLSKLIKEHKTGKNSHFAKIIQLMTLETTVRNMEGFIYE
ncbi:asparagine synthase-related protein [Verrucomicrobia bacterium]|nr:asparagine synthase-related protein [Verrucomicrobiota bacterium]